MAVTTPLIASLTALGLLLGGGAAALTLDDNEPSNSGEDCSTAADEWACYEERIREACHDHKMEPREPSMNEPPSETVHPQEPDECRQAYEEAIAEYCADHADDPRCSDQCPTDGPRTTTDEYPSRCQQVCEHPKQDPATDEHRKCATAEEPKEEPSKPLLPGIPIVE